MNKQPPPLPPLRAVIAANGLGAKKGLGQHFLLDLNLTQKIVASAGDLNGCTVFEIGPGPGGLTRPLIASNAREIIAIEKDSRCVAALQPLVLAAEGRLRLIDADALTVDLASLAPSPRVVIANLPYNVGTLLLVNWLKQMESFQSLTLMFQEEVADRILASPNTKAYGRLSVIAQSLCNVKRVLSIPARAFTPPPKIDSAVVHFTPRKRDADKPNIEDLEKITAAAFGQRRKMLRSSLKSLGGEELLAKAGLNPTARAEDLSIADFEKLASFLKAASPFE
jgi:16S rRNA (adenine1518-N6/adenine1519-N6)-dimethyltransferase